MECVIIQKRNLITLEISPLLPQGTKPDPVFVLVCIFCINLVMIWRGKKKKRILEYSDEFPIFWNSHVGKNLFCVVMWCDGSQQAKVARGTTAPPLPLRPWLFEEQRPFSLQVQN